MRRSYLEVTYRKGRPLAAYFHLPRKDGVTTSWTERAESGLIVDYAPDGSAIGIEITSPSRLELRIMNEILARLGHGPIREEDLAPLVAL